MNALGSARFIPVSILVSAIALTGSFAQVQPRSESIGSTPAAVTLSTCTNPDNGDPDLTGFRFSPPVVDVRDHAQLLHVIATATDDSGPGPATGVHQFLVGFGVYTAAQQGLLELHPSNDGTWVGDLLVPAGIAPGVHPLDTVELSDGAGNNKHYGTAWLEAHALAPSVTIVSTADSKPPQVSRLTASRSSVDSRRGAVKVRYTADLSDAGSGIGLAFVEGYSRATLHRVSGTDRHGRWTGTVTVPRFQAQALASYDLSIYVLDKVQNYRSLVGTQLAHRDWPSTLRIRGRTDTTPPTLRLARQPASTVDLRQRGGRLTVAIRAIDAGSGVDASGLGFEDDSLNYSGRLVSGDHHRGTWRVTIPLPYCGNQAGTHKNTVSLGGWDRLGRVAVVPRAFSYQTVSGDTRAPRRARFTPFEVTAGSPAVLVFGESVTGITDVTAPVRPFDPDATSGDDPQPPVAGSWSCQSGDGTSVDCAVGAVRTARWTPAEPLTLGRYLADINPEHVLGVTDLAGNAPTDLLSVFLATP